MVHTVEDNPGVVRGCVGCASGAVPAPLDPQCANGLPGSRTRGHREPTNRPVWRVCGRWLTTVCPFLLIHHKPSQAKAPETMAEPEPERDPLGSAPRYYTWYLRNSGQRASSSSNGISAYSGRNSMSLKAWATATATWQKRFELLLPPQHPDVLAQRAARRQRQPRGQHPRPRP